MRAITGSIVAGIAVLLLTGARVGAQCPSPQARAFPTAMWRVIPVGVGGPNLCLQVEPIGGSYVNDQVDITSFTLTSEGTGSVTSIPCMPPKSVVVGDHDGNGFVELPAWFAQNDLALLFDKIKGRTDVTAVLSGRLVDGTPICALAPLNLIHPKHHPRSLVTPNPINPRGVLRVTTSHPGTLRVRVFDLQGRWVRTLADGPAEPGTHDIEVDGLDQAGHPLGSGVYFFVAETSDGTLRGRFAVLK
jgi:flagellar hook capping protein FlgD